MDFIASVVKECGKYLNQPFSHNLDELCIDASVIIPIIKENNILNILFTKRTDSLRNHSSQISFPGGVRETIDLLPIDTAIREFKEEIGYEISTSEIIGALEPRNSITGFCIYPYIGLIEGMKNFEINGLEVERIIKVPLDWLKTPSNYTKKPYKRQGYGSHPVVFFQAFDGEVIWGITAEILLSLFELLKK